MGGQKGIALCYKSLSKLISLQAITTQKNEPNESYPVFPILSNSKFRYLNTFLYFILQKKRKEQQSTHILFEHPYYAWLLWLTSKTSSIKTIVHSHNIESERFHSIGKWWWKIMWYYERWAYRTADHVWFKTDEDRNYAVIHYGLKAERCVTIPYGIEPNALPEKTIIQAMRDRIRERHQVNQDEKIILFNGTLSYKPNLDALDHILHRILPLLNQKGLRFKILVCGKGLPDSYDELKAFIQEGMVYCGFVDDTDEYFLAADLFLNPLQDGGGIKTKLVEALGFGIPSVSSKNGAIGVPANITAGRLQVVSDKDWPAYAQAIEELLLKSFNDDHDAFYRMFNWDHIAARAVESLG